MFKFGYIVYGLIVLIACTVTNMNYAAKGTTAGSGWSSQGGGFAWGGSSGSTGGFFSGVGHK
jgi:hypothetical protein